MHMLLLLIQIKYAIKEVIITALSFSFSCIHFHKLLLRSTTFAPVKILTVSFVHSAPWITPELRELKTKGRRLERL